jgi:hypothetical protein
VSEKELSIRDLKAGGSEPAGYDLKHAETTPRRIVKAAIGDKRSFDLRSRAEETRAKLKNIRGTWTAAQQ